MSCISELFWREGLSMDSSIFSDDDTADCRYPASSLKRCDRQSVLGMPSADHASTYRNSSLMRSRSCNCSSLEKLYFYCTEELGSESASGVGKTMYTYENEFMFSHSAAAPWSPPQVSSSGRCTQKEDNCACQSQVCASSSCTSSPSCNKDTHPSSTRKSSLPHTFHINALPHRHCDTAFEGGRDRAFPPPITSLLTDRPLMLSFKSDGRFVLKKVTNSSRSLFRSSREKGHLRLDLLSCSGNRSESWYGSSASVLPDLQVVPSVESMSAPSFWHGKGPSMKNLPYLYDWLRSPSPYTITLHRKSMLNCESLCPPSKLQATAAAMCMHHPKVAGASLGEESVSSPSISFEVEHLIKSCKTTQANTAMVKSRLYIFALLKLLPCGLSLIIFEIGRLKGSDSVTMYGVNIPKDFGLECGRGASMSPSCHRLDEFLGGRNECAKGRLSFSEDCWRNGYMKGVFSY